MFNGRTNWLDDLVEDGTRLRDARAILHAEFGVSIEHEETPPAWWVFTAQNKYKFTTFTDAFRFVATILKHGEPKKGEGMP